MKLCHHPNIVRLLDHFENAEYILIIIFKWRKFNKLLKKVNLHYQKKEY